jgi:hypothetical protein
MSEMCTNCETNCVFFKALHPEQQYTNLVAREVILKGDEFPGSLNTICGGCAKQKINESYLEEKIKEFLHGTK